MKDISGDGDVRDIRNKSTGNDASDGQKSSVSNKWLIGQEVWWTILLATISYITFPTPLQPVGRPTVLHVWYFGWISAISTGLGVLPLMFTRELDTYWIGASNAIAAGMMIAASYSLILEGCKFDEQDDMSTISSEIRTLIGIGSGLLFITATKSFLDQHEEIKVGSLDVTDSRKILLMILVMTLHSFSEGVGIGVSFGGSNGIELGVFISVSLAVHNVPEGLAVAIALLPRKLSSLQSALWCVMTSIPQPLMAVPAFIFCHYFIPILPVGLGFAGGAMAYVALFELFKDGVEDTNIFTGTVLSTLSMGCMLALQGALDERD